MNRNKIIEEINLDFQNIELFIANANYKKAIKLANAIYYKADSISYQDGINTYYNKIIFILYYTNQYVLAITMIKILVPKYLKNKKLDEISRLYNLLGIILSTLSDFDGSIYYLNKSLDMAYKVKPVDFKRVSSVHLGIANNYYNQSQNSKAIENIEIGLSFFISEKDVLSNYIIYFYLKIGQMFILIKQNKFKKVEDILSGLYTDCKEFGVKEQAYFENIKINLLLQTDYNSLELVERCTKLLDLAELILDSVLILSVLGFFKIYYCKVKNFKKALFYSNKQVEEYARNNVEASVLQIKEFNKGSTNFLDDYILFPKNDILKVAKFQQNFNSQSFSSNKLFIDTHYKSSKYLSGDYLGTFKLDDKGNYSLFVLADAISERVTSSYITFMLDGIIKSIIKNASHYDLKSIVKDINVILSESLNEQGSVSLWAGIIDLSKGKLESVNAGSIPSFLLSKNKITQLNKGCSILGMSSNLPKIEIEYVDFIEGDILFSFSEGVKSTIENSNQSFESVIKNMIKLFSEDTSMDFKDLFDTEISKLKDMYQIEEDISYLQIGYKI